MKDSHLFFTLLSLTITVAGFLLKNNDQQDAIDRMKDPKYQQQIQNLLNTIKDNDSTNLYQYRVSANLLDLKFDPRAISRNLDEFLLPTLNHPNSDGDTVFLGFKDRIELVDDENYAQVKSYLSYLSSGSEMDADTVRIEYIIFTNSRALTPIEVTLRGNNGMPRKAIHVNPFSSIALISSFSPIEDIQPYTSFEYTDRLTGNLLRRDIDTLLTPVLLTSDVEILEIEH